ARQPGILAAQLVGYDGAERGPDHADLAAQAMAGQRALQVDDVIARWTRAADRANDSELLGHARQARQVLAEAHAGNGGGDDAERTAGRRAGLGIEGLE